MEMLSQVAGQFSATLTLVIQCQPTQVQFINKNLKLVLRARSVRTEKKKRLLLQIWFGLSLLTYSLSIGILEVFAHLPSYRQMVFNSDSSCSKSKHEGRYYCFLAMFTNLQQDYYLKYVLLWLHAICYHLNVAGLLEVIKGMWHRDFSLLWSGFFLPELVRMS